jgi:hypothetical protein
LYRTANQIGDVIGSASGLLWQSPSGDYGHPGVQTGWGSFIDDVKSEVEKLAKKAEGHGEDLRTAAGKYAESDTQAGDAIGQLGAGLFDSLGGLQGAPGGGITGGTPGKISGSIDGPTGVMSPERSKELFPGSSGGTQRDARGEGPVY